MIEAQQQSSWDFQVMTIGPFAGRIKRAASIIIIGKAIPLPAVFGLMVLVRKGSETEFQGDIGRLGVALLYLALVGGLAWRSEAAKRKALRSKSLGNQDDKRK
jgi:hypothetical protein